MRSHRPYQLTDREREVLELLRRDFTNERIAQRLGISLDGAKYHVSQILSKLGVATREEAAALALGERRRLWAALPLWVRIAGAATAVAAAAGFALLAWGVLRTSGHQLFDLPPPPSGSTCQQVIDYLNEEIPREGRSMNGMRFYTKFPADLGGGIQPDFVVEVNNPESRDDFLNRKKLSEDQLQEWLAPSGLRLDDFLLIYYADKLEFDMGRDPETGKLLTEKIGGTEQIAGDVSCTLGCSWEQLVAPRTCPTPTSVRPRSPVQ